MIYSVRKYLGLVREIQPGAAWITCPAESIPAPGRYLLAWRSAAHAAALAQPVFSVSITQDAFLAMPSLPDWQPGDRLQLLGPLGRGFNIPASTHRLALVALRNSPAHLLALMELWLARGAAIALFTDHLPHQIHFPDALEIYPVRELPQALGWADILAFDLDRKQLANLRQILLLQTNDLLPCPAQALVRTPTPCGGMAGCGVCSVKSQQGWKLACSDGPVFDLKELDW